MKTKHKFTGYLVFLILLSMIYSTGCFAADPVLLSDIVKLASQEEGRRLLTTEDGYTAKWSKFDIVSRSQNQEGTKKELLGLMKKQVLNWTEEETTRIRELLDEIDQQIKKNGYDLPLPKEITLIKSTIAEEGGAVGYTREDYIVLRQDLIFMEDEMLKNLLLHELFHILSRHDPEFRKAVYEVIGFNVGNPVNYPENLADLKLTNPDAHNNDSYIKLTTKDADTIEAVMILYAKEPWNGGSFFTYLQIGFAAVEGHAGDKKIRYSDGEPMIYDFGEVDGFLEQVGSNTQYIIDPEEICADNFAYVFIDKKDRPSPEIVEQIRDILLERRD